MDRIWANLGVVHCHHGCIQTYYNPTDMGRRAYDLEHYSIDSNVWAPCDSWLRTWSLAGKSRHQPKGKLLRSMYRFAKYKLVELANKIAVWRLMRRLRPTKELFDNINDNIYADIRKIELKLARSALDYYSSRAHIIGIPYNTYDEDEDEYVDHHERIEYMRHACLKIRRDLRDERVKRLKHLEGWLSLLKYILPIWVIISAFIGWVLLKQ